MRKPDFLYFVADIDGKPLVADTRTKQVSAADPATLLRPDGTGAWLRFTPDGWLDVLIKYGVNIKYWGLFRTFSVPIKFTGDGAIILRHLFYTQGVESFCKLIILKNDRNSFPERHKTWYVGEPDFAKFRQGEDANVEINIMEGGVSKLLKAFEETEYQIPVDDDPQHINILMDGLDLDCKFNYETFFSNAETGTGTHLIPHVFVNGEGTQLNVVHNNVILGQLVSGGYQGSSDQWIVQAKAETEITIAGSLRVLPLSSDGTYTVRFRTNTNRTHTILTQVLTDPTYTLAINSTFNVLANESVFLEAEWSGANDIEYGSARFSISFKNKFQSSVIKALRPFRVFEKIVEKMTDGKYTVKSDWLNSLSDYAVTSGDAIRGIAGAVIKTSLAKFYKSFNRWGIMLCIEGEKIVIENIDYRFRTDQSVDLGEVSGFEVSVAEDLCFNTIRCGYAPQEYEDVNGRFEFNQSQQWTSSFTRIVKELNIESPYRADPYGIEFTRINFEGKTTTDDSSDNDTFLLNIETQLTTDGDLSYYKLNRPAFDSVTGVPYPESIFNVLLSPKRSILSNGKMIRSVLHLGDAGVLKFQTATKNSDLSTTLGAEVITENADITIGSLGDRLFLPVYFSFTTALPLNVQNTIRQFPYHRIRFSFKGQSFTGYLWDGGVKPATDDEQQWKLLAAPDNDLTKLI